MLSADIDPIDIVVIHSAVLPDVPTIPKRLVNGLIAMRNATNLHYRGTHGAKVCLANDQADDSLSLPRITRVHVIRFEGNIVGIHDELRIGLSLRSKDG